MTIETSKPVDSLPLVPQTKKKNRNNDFRRNQELYNAGAIALQIVNQKRADRDSAQAQVNEAQQALALQKAGSRPEDISQARAVVKQRQEALALLQAGSRREDIDAAPLSLSPMSQILPPKLKELFAYKMV
jgi:multidrug resistance efflux pump